MDDLRFFRYGPTELVLIDRRRLDFDEHCHCFDYIITTVKDGQGTLVIGGASRTLCAGDTFTVRPYEAHSLCSDTPVSLMSLCLDKRIFASEGLLTERDISVFLSSALSLFDERRDDTTDEYILPSRSSIEEHPERGFDLDHYAVNANYSKYHFIRRFRKAAGLTPHRFIIQNRIRKAQRLLDDGSRITETAVSVGFYDQSHFDKYFRKIVGILPKEYISSNRRQQGNFLQE